MGETFKALGSPEGSLRLMILIHLQQHSITIRVINAATGKLTPSVHVCNLRQLIHVARNVQPWFLWTKTKESMPPFDAFVFGKVMQDMAWNVDGARKPATRVNWWIAVNIYRTPHGFLPQWLASVQIFKSDCKEPKSHLGWKLNRQFLNWLTSPGTGAMIEHHDNK